MYSKDYIDQMSVLANPPIAGPKPGQEPAQTLCTYEGMLIIIAQVMRSPIATLTYLGQGKLI